MQEPAEVLQSLAIEAVLKSALKESHWAGL